jgi:hypothetical protein
MNLTPNTELLLKAILAGVKRLEAVPDRPAPGTDRDDWREQCLERQEYRECGVRHDLAQWLGHPPSPSDSAVFSRALRNMEAMGLVLRLNRWGGSKTTHVRLTPLGRAEAERLAGERHAEMEALLADLPPIDLPQTGDEDRANDARGQGGRVSPPKGR